MLQALQHKGILKPKIWKFKSTVTCNYSTCDGSSIMLYTLRVQSLMGTNFSEFQS